MQNVTHFQNIAGVANTTNVAVCRVWQRLCAPMYFCVLGYEIIAVTSTDWAHAASYPQSCPPEVGGAGAECYLWTPKVTGPAGVWNPVRQRRRPRVPIVLSYSSLQLNSVRETQCNCCQTSGVLQQPVELIMFCVARSRTQSAAIILSNPLNVPDSANLMLTPCYRR